MNTGVAALLRLQHPKLADWVAEVEALTEPDDVVLVDGSEAQRQGLIDMLIAQGVLTLLGGSFMGSYLARSDPRDVARVVSDTHICSPRDSGPLTNWWDPADALPEMRRRLAGVMRERTMYVVPFSMGPIGSELSRIVVQLTDSAYVAVNTLIMARTGQRALDQLGSDGAFTRAIHSVGVPLAPGEQDVPWPCNPAIRKICHFPEDDMVISIGSGYGGNSLLGKKCVALRLGTARAAKHPTGARAEHMMLIRVRQIATGRVRHIAAAFPSACGKTNLAMLVPTIPGYEITTLGDDILWMRVGADGRIYGINPEAGFFGVAPGTGPRTNAVATNAILKPGSLLTNVAFNPKTREAWWPGLSGEPPARLITWKGVEWHRDTGDVADTVHANARFTTPYAHCDTADLAAWDDPDGVPIDAMLFGGRRPDTIPLVRLARNWREGVLFGAMVSSATTAAAEGRVGQMAHDPFAMAPFFGLRVMDYIRHWLSMGRCIEATHGPSGLPVFGYVDWFREDAAGNFLWPGFGENGRVIDVIIRYLDGELGEDDLTATPAGLVPEPGVLNVEGLDVPPGALEELLAVDPAAWLAEVREVKAYYANTFGDDFPAELLELLDEMEREFEEALV